VSFHRPQRSIWVNDFTAGYLDSPQSDAIPPGATPDAKNAFLYDINLDARTCSMGRRKGTRLCNATTLSSGKRVDGLFDYRRPGASATLIAMCNGQLSSIDPVAGTTASLGASFGTAGNTARFVPYKSNVIIYDGSAQRRWDGTTLYTLGMATPGTITNMVAGAGTLTGTYEAVYTWYDSVLDRDSSISTATATLVLAGQGRTHTRPGSTIPSSATHWRAWVRRTDTNELNYYLAGSQVVGTAALTETLSDAARRLQDIAAKPNVNDPPPGNFAVLAEIDGYGIGALANATDYYVSKIGDLESWHPKDKFPVSRATGEALSWARAFAGRRLIGTPHGTWELRGDRVPFAVKNVHTMYGNVSQDAVVEVDSLLYGWDRVRGPYVTDLSTWRPLADHRIGTFVDTINRGALTDIRAVHDEVRSLVIWAVPTTSTRRRTLLAYHTLLGCWLPPITGLEYGSLSPFTDSNSALGLYLGDYWGRIYELFSGSREGVPSGTVSAPITGSSASTATCSSATFYTTGSGLAGLPVAAVSPAGVWQWRRIQSNTATQITLDTTNDAPWTTTPATDGTWTLVVGGIDWFWRTPWLDFGAPHKQKKGGFVYVQCSAEQANLTLSCKGRFNEEDGTIQPGDYNFAVPVGSARWGSAVWGTSLWGGRANRTLQKQRINRSFLSAQLHFYNAYPDQEIKILMYGLQCDEQPRRSARSVR